MNTLRRQPAQTLQLNEVGRGRIKSHDPICYDAYQRNRQTGSFILVDRITHETVAAGMFLDRRLEDGEDEGHNEFAGLKL